MSGKILYYAGASALCWKHPRQADPDFLTMRWAEVTCPRCMELRPPDESDL